MIKLISTAAVLVVCIIVLFIYLSLSLFLPVNASGLLAFACLTCRIQYDGRSLHCLLFLLHYNVVSLCCRGFVTTELVSL